MKTNITFVYSVKKSFVEADLKILKDLNTRVIEIYSPPLKNLYFFINRLREIFLSLSSLYKSSLLVCWFNDYHSFFPLLLARIFMKKSILIVGGYDAIVDKQSKHGLFYKRGLRTAVAKLNYRFAQEIWVVHNTLEFGCQQAYFDNGIISGIRNIIKQDMLNIKEVPTGYDSKFWKNIKKQKSNSVVTVAFFNSQRVLDIKGISLFNEIAKRIQNYNFTIVGEAGIKISDYIELSRNVTVMGIKTQTQLREIYSNHRYYFQGSRLEGLPNSLCEAMLCECTPIGSEYFGIPHVIGETGLIFNKSNALETVIQFILNNNDINTSKARQRIINHFNISYRKKHFMNKLKK